jgi:DNA polymerase-1
MPLQRQMEVTMNKKIVLIDGHSILNRAFYGLPDMTTSKGEHTNAVLGFINIMFKILEEEKPDYLSVAFDTHHPTFRHDMFTEYKGTRKGMPEELREQVPVMKEVLRAMRVPILEKPGYEADDILGTLATRAEQAGDMVSLISGDRDLLQLASEKIKIRIPKTKKTGTEIEDYLAADVMAAYHVTPKQFIDLKGLMGDTSDNIPGVPGVGEKTAAKLIETYHSIENIYEHIDEMNPGKVTNSLKENRELAFLSKQLATICVDCELEFKTEEAVLENLYNEDVYMIFKRLEFKNLLSRFRTEEVNHSTGIEKKFIIIDDLGEAERIFGEASDKKASPVGIQIIFEHSRILGVALCNTQEQACFLRCGGFLTEDYLRPKPSQFQT